MSQEQTEGLFLQRQALPEASAEKELSVNFADWDIPECEVTPVIEEYLWGVRCGVMQYINADNYSLASVLAAAKTDEMCEIYSPAKVQYFSDGSRKVIPHGVSAYNTDAKFGCYYQISLKQAEDLFPEYREVFAMLPPETRFLCSPNADKIRIANTEKDEIGFSFSAVDCFNQPASFFQGNLRATFQYIAQELEAGRGLAFCDTDCKNPLDYLESKICFLCGGSFPFQRAIKLANDEETAAIRQSYIKHGAKGKDKFTVLINGSFVEEDAGFNTLATDGEDITICVSPAVYRSWGQPFTRRELEIINAGRSFNFDEEAEKSYFSKINRLRFDQRHIKIFAKYSQEKKIIEVEELDEIIRKQAEKLEKEQQVLLKEAEKNQRFLREEQKRKEALEEERERQRRYAMRDTSGPSRSSMYTGYNF